MMSMILRHCSVKYIIVSHVSRRRPDKFEPEMSVVLQIYVMRVPVASGSVVVDVEVQIDFMCG